MNLGLKNKRVLVSGSSQGIGLEIAKSFLKEGAMVAISARGEEQLLKAEQELLTQFDRANVCSHVCDFTQVKSVIALIESIQNQWAGIDIVVCNVGNGSSIPPGQETYDEWQRVFGINFFSATNLIEASRTLLEKSGGSIVCISSICGSETISGAPVTYSVAKSALNTYVKSISVPLALEGIRINAVAPGNINFEGSVWSEKLVQDPDLVKEMLKRDVPLRRFGSPDDVANVAVWLASDLAKFITGTVVTTDGGQTSS